MNKTFFILFTAILTSPLYGSELCPSASESVDLEINKDSRSPSESLLVEPKWWPSLPEIDLRFVTAALRTPIPSRTNAEAKHVCHFCNKSFKYKRHLTTHNRIHTGEKPFQCSICKQNFSQKGNRDTHERMVHKRKKPFECPSCNKSFTQKVNLTIHKSIHDAKKPFECPSCKKRFSRKGNRDTHISSVHSDKRFFACHYKNCNLSFSLSHNLNNHKNEVHYGKKIYKCDKCGREFSRSGNLDRHLRTHTGEKPFACKICKKEFRQIASLNRHIRRAHKKKKPAEYVIDHRHGDNNNSLPSPQKNCTQSTEEPFQNHKTPYHCSLCDINFESRDELTSHVAACLESLFSTE